MLPAEGKLTEEQIRGVARRFGDFVRERRITLVTVSKQLGKGYSQSRLSFFKTGDLRGDSEQLARVLNTYMEEFDRRESSTVSSDFVETEVARRMLTIIRTTKNAAMMGVIVGPAGVGKTMCARAAAQMIPGAIYLRVNQSSRRGPGLMNAIARELGEDRRGSLIRLHDAVGARLRGSGRLIILDEAHQLAQSGLDSARDLHDDSQVAIVLVGTHRLHDAVNDRDVYFGQFSSRITARLDVTELAINGPKGRPLFTVEEIRQVFESHKLKLTDDGATFLARLASIPGHGSLRVCAAVLRVIAQMPKFAERPIGEDLIKKVIRQLHGGTELAAMQQRVDEAARRVA